MSHIKRATLGGNERPIATSSGPAIFSRGTAVQRHTARTLILREHWQTRFQLQTSQQRRGTTGFKSSKGGSDKHVTLTPNASMSQAAERDQRRCAPLGHGGNWGAKQVRHGSRSHDGPVR